MRLPFYILVFILTSCSASFHLKKAVKKNPDILSKKDTTIEAITKIPVMTVNGIQNRDTVFYLDINCPEINTEVLKDGTFVKLIEHREKMKSLRNENKTNRREYNLKIENVKQENKTLRDSIKHYFRSEKVSHRQENKTQRQESRQENRTDRVKSRKWSLWLGIAVVFFILGIFANKIIKRFNIL